MFKYDTIRLNGSCYNASTLGTFIDTATSTDLRELYSELVEFLEHWFDGSDTIEVHTSGSTGIPKPICVRKEHMINSAKLTCEFFHLSAVSNLLLCMPIKYIAGRMMLVRALVSGASLWVEIPSGRPFRVCSQKIDFVALVPLQLYNSLVYKEDRERLLAVKQVLIGGGAISPELTEALQTLPNQCYASYGMTETVSHIALRCLNGKDKSDWYKPLNQVKIDQLPSGALVIEAPLVSEGILKTNDVVVLGDAGFKIIGRLDNIINSGGVKLQIEQIEEKLNHLINGPFAITYRSDAKLGAAVVLLIADDRGNLPAHEALKACLSVYEIPKNIYAVEAIPKTETGKIKRDACHVLAEQLYKMRNNESRD